MRLRTTTNLHHRSFSVLAYKYHGGRRGNRAPIRWGLLAPARSSWRVSPLPFGCPDDQRNPTGIGKLCTLRKRLDGDEGDRPQRAHKCRQIHHVLLRVDLPAFPDSLHSLDLEWNRWAEGFLSGQVPTLPIGLPDHGGLQLRLLEQKLQQPGDQQQLWRWRLLRTMQHESLLLRWLRLHKQRAGVREPAASFATVSIATTVAATAAAYDAGFAAVVEGFPAAFTALGAATRVSSEVCLRHSTICNHSDGRFYRAGALDCQLAHDVQHSPESDARWRHPPLRSAHQRHVERQATQRRGWLPLLHNRDRETA